MYVFKIFTFLVLVLMHLASSSQLEVHRLLVTTNRALIELQIPRNSEKLEGKLKLKWAGQYNSLDRI